MSIYEDIQNGKYKNDVPFKDNRDAWWAQERKLTDQFYDDIYAEYNLNPDNPKHSAMMRIAWDHGYSAGLSEVLYWIEELVELVQ